MTINDGYGEQMPLEQVEDIIRQKERLIHLQVAERGGDPNLWDDLLNEARITIWEVLRKRPDASPAYIHASTGMRITEVLMRGKFYGQPSQRGKVSVDPIRRKDRDSLDDPLFQVESSSPDTLEALLMAYHEGEILQAINDLPENHRTYVMLRFWGGWTAGEMAPIIGVKSTNQGRMWNESIRPLLVERLGHLVDA